MRPATVFTAFLDALGVPHTVRYSDKRFGQMTFRSLFGLSKLLESYGIPNEALSVPDKRVALDLLPVPFLAGMDDTFVVVTDKTPGSVTVDRAGREGKCRMDTGDFIGKWSGIILAAYPAPDSAEPAYRRHRILDIAERAKRWALMAAVAFVFVYLFVADGIYAHPTTVLLTLIFGAGLYVTYELMLKSLHIHSERGDSICGLIDRTGCHTVLSTKAASFFGLFGWSEVGLAYFSVSLGCLLVFPQYLPCLALINACCCPFSLWSVWYQKYRAKAWCTLCLITQGCLWSALMCFIAGGWFRGAFPLQMQLFVLGATYVAVLWGLNALTPLLNRKPDNNSDK